MLQREDDLNEIVQVCVFLLFLELYVIMPPDLIYLGEGDGGVDVALPLGLFCFKELFHLYLV